MKLRNVDIFLAPVLAAVAQPRHGGKDVTRRARSETRRVFVLFMEYDLNTKKDKKLGIFICKRVTEIVLRNGNSEHRASGASGARAESKRYLRQEICFG
ncbi:hypothetical protein EVAR_3832_1 [Eumeta japonica]|uniref:Uncharacterized protein n=1 Tax=Eumeta variegata TaxID=151549 RepID=A0A4C1SR92_EUMVA|nr:hypothetical protein EVAR_3832_1 [Eumeta japonica]